MAGPPNDLSAVAQTDGTVDLTWTNDGPYSSLAMYRRVSPAAFAKIDDLLPEDESYTDDDSLSEDTTYDYRLTCNLGDSNVDSCTQWTAYPSADGITMSEVVYSLLSASVTVTDGFSMSEATEVEVDSPDPQEYEVTETDTITMSDDYEITHITGQNWTFYLGSDAGAICHYDESYKGDAGADISAYFQSKAFDFADQYPQFIDTVKTVESVYLDYLDKQECHVVMEISTDNGTTWTLASKTLGNGANIVKMTRFDFPNVTGRFFLIKLSNTSSDRTFQWLKMQVVFAPHTDWFDVS